MTNPVAAIVGGTRGIGLAMGKQWLQNQLKKDSRNTYLPHILFAIIFILCTLYNLRTTVFLPLLFYLVW